MADGVALTEATPFTLDSVSGTADSLVLTDRALPYRPLVIGGKQRAEFTWFPGSPSAVVQMLGPEEAPITIKGFWKDRFLYTAPAIAKHNNEGVQSAAELVDIVDRMRRRGALYRLSWDKLVRYGHITNFEQTWYNTHDVEWSIEFSVSAQDEDAAVVVTPNKAQPAQIAADIEVPAQAARETSQAAKVANNAIAPSASLESLLSEIDDLLLSYTNSVTGVAVQITNGIMAYPEAARSMFSIIGRTMTSVSATASNIADRAIGESYVFAGGQDSCPIGQQVAACSYLNSLLEGVNSLQRVSAFGRYEVQKQMQQDATQSFLATADTDFRDISTQFYGTPDGWVQLMLYNGYEDSAVQAGALIWVPPYAVGAIGSGGDY